MRCPIKIESDYGIFGMEFVITLFIYRGSTIYYRTYVDLIVNGYSVLQQY